MNTQQAYPLSWPPSWPRIEAHRRQAAPFHRLGANKIKLQLTLAGVVSEIYRELRLIGVGESNVVISTNIKLRLDGLPAGGQAMPADSGVAVYFQLKGKPCVLACDKWRRVEDNLSAIARDIEAQRARQRWGVGSVEQAFAGYTALPPPGSSPGTSWWNVLGCAHDAPFDVVQDAYRAKAKVAHPDRNGGDSSAMYAINDAWDQARRAFQ